MPKEKKVFKTKLMFYHKILLSFLFCPILIWVHYEDILNIFSLVIKKMEGKCLYFDRGDINKRDILNKYKDINFLKVTKITFETNDLYQYFIISIYDYLSQSEGLYFNSIYSAIYFRRIIYYLQ